VGKSGIPKSPPLTHKFLAHNAMGPMLPRDSIGLLGTVLPLLRQLGKASVPPRCSSILRHRSEAVAPQESQHIQGSIYQVGKLSRSSVLRLRTRQVHMERRCRLDRHVL
jgi:hypothetical protein